MCTFHNRNGLKIVKVIFTFTPQAFGVRFIFNSTFLSCLPPL
nr:MAG TPA: hypothetical protein [Caudoviricetes sp.]